MLYVSNLRSDQVSELTRKGIDWTKGRIPLPNRMIFWKISKRPLTPPPHFWKTRPKPAYGRQGLDWDRWARIQFSQVHFGAKLDSTDLLWCKNVTSPTGGSNRPFRCLEEGGRALPKFLAPFQNVSKKHSGYDLLLNKYSGGFREITILM